MISLDRSRVTPFLDESASRELRPRVEAAHQTVLDGTGPGAEMLGWRDLVLKPDEQVLADVQEVAAEIRDRADVLLCIGIGGSYLGAEAVISALSPYFGPASGVDVRFAGHHLSPTYHRQLLE